MNAPISPVSVFCSQLVRFFEELADTFPEEREIRAAVEAIQSARKINPKLVLDMFVEHIVNDLREAIATENADYVILVGRQKIKTQFNEILPAIMIFEKHWPTLHEENKQVIWKYLKVLVALSDKARGNK